MTYDSPAAFRQALDERLRQHERNTGEPLIRLRKRLMFERLMVRLQERKESPWVLKGGFALELRVGDGARITKSLDVGVDLAYVHTTDLSVSTMTRKLREDVSSSSVDHFTFAVSNVGESGVIIPGMTPSRYTVEARLDGRPFDTCTIDIGFGDPLIPPFDHLAHSDILDFANVHRVPIRATSRAQHFGEKIHALTRRYEDPTPTRVKDLADILVLLNLGLPDTDAVSAIVTEIFAARKTHTIPRVIEPQSRTWASSFSVMAKELELDVTNLDDAMTWINQYWKTLFP